MSIVSHKLKNINAIMSINCRDSPIKIAFFHRRLYNRASVRMCPTFYIIAASATSKPEMQQEKEKKREKKRQRKRLVASGMQ